MLQLFISGFLSTLPIPVPFLRRLMKTPGEKHIVRGEKEIHHKIKNTIKNKKEPPRLGFVSPLVGVV